MDTKEFRSLRNVPTQPEEVVWQHLEESFHQQCIENLSLLSELCQAATNDAGLSFYVGAGVSLATPSNLPVASSILTALFDICQQQYGVLESSVNVIMQALESGHYLQMETVLEQVYECIAPDEFHIGHIFDVPSFERRSNVNHAFLAKWLQSNRGTVVTTNLDPLIEQAWTQYGTPATAQLEVIKRPSDFSSWEQKLFQRDVLWKLHGSADDSESWAITLPKIGFTVKDKRRDFLLGLIQRQHICFIGYSAADIDLVPVILEAHASKTGNEPKLFWAFYFNEDKRTLEDYLHAAPNIQRLYRANPGAFVPIVTTAERLCTWLERQCFNTEAQPPELPETSTNTTVNYRYWIEQDIKQIGYIGATKVVGVTLRVLGEHDASVQLLNERAETLIRLSANKAATSSELNVIAQLLQESAHTYWQQDKYAEALTQVEKAWEVLKVTDDELARAWCQYGRVTMTLDARWGVSTKQRFLALIRLGILYRWFRRLELQMPTNSSPIIGQGLCLLYFGKLWVKVSRASGLIQFRPNQHRIVSLLDHAEALLRKGEFPNSIPDVKRWRAVARVWNEPSEAVQDMIDAITTARAVTHAHLHYTIRRAKDLIELIADPELRNELQQAINQAEEDKKEEG